MRWTLPALFVCATAWAAPDADPAPDAPPQAEVVTVEQGPVIDGVIDDVVWRQATPVTAFQPYLPTDAQPVTGHTEVRFLQDETTLYVAIRVTDTPDPVRARIAYREAINADDQIGLYLDPFGEAQNGYIFYTNPLGIQQDIQFTAGRWNVSWNAVYQTKGRVLEDGHGFELEIALPFRSIQYPRGREVQTWGVMVTRKAPAEGAKFAWPKLTRGHPRLFTQAAALSGVRPPSRPAGIELIPGLTGRVEAVRPTVDDPFTWTDAKPWDEAIRPSLDVRAALTPNLTFIGTANPDFSQVEADVTPVVLNARFAFRFAERRPYFTEGAGYFEDAHDTLYSRSIVEPLYGLKLAGREGRWSMGMLHALDRSPVPSVHERGTPGFSPDDVDGRWASNTMVRLRHDLPNAGFVGITLADKRLVSGGFRSEGVFAGPRSSHDTLGLDVSVPLGERWTVTARHDQSLTQSRDDRVSGTATGVGVQRASGQGLGASVSGSFLSEGYRQELGFRTQSGYGQADASLDWTQPGRGVLTTWRPGLSAGVFQETNGDHFQQLGLSQEVVLDRVHTLTVDGRLTHRREDDATDIPAIVRGWDVGLAYTGQAGMYLDITPQVRLARVMNFVDLTPAQRLVAQVDATVRPAKPLRLDLIGRYTRFRRLADADPDAFDPLPLEVLQDVLVRGRLQWQFTPVWGLRLISEFNQVTTQDARLESSALVTWLFNPYTAAYLGYAEVTSLGPEQVGTLDRSVFAKVQVLIRP